MRKVLIAAVAMAIAVCAQASAVKWSANSIKDINGNAVGATEGKYTIVATFWDSTGKDILTTSQTTSTTAMSGASATWSGADLSTTYYAQLVITDSAGNSITSEKAAFTTSGSATYNIIFNSGKGFATQTAKIDYSTGWVAAPEPTSGLLLLLGMAGLALKRKRA